MSTISGIIRAMVEAQAPTGVSGKKLVPLMFLAFFVFTVVMGFGTFFLGKLFEPISKRAYEQYHRQN